MHSVVRFRPASCSELEAAKVPPVTPSKPFEDYAVEVPVTVFVNLRYDVYGTPLESVVAFQITDSVSHLELCFHTLIC